MATEEAIRRKQSLLAKEVQRYFEQTGPELTAKWALAIVDLTPSLLRELVGRLRELEAITNCADRELNAAFQAAATEGHESAEGLLDRALASMELLGEAAEKPEPKGGRVVEDLEADQIALRCNDEQSYMARPARSEPKAITGF